MKIFELHWDVWINQCYGSRFKVMYESERCIKSISGHQNQKSSDNCFAGIPASIKAIEFVSCDNLKSEIRTHSANNAKRPLTLTWYL